MNDADQSGPPGVMLDEPFHGRVGFSASRAPSGRVVNLAVSIERSWDADILISLSDAVALAEALGGPKLHIATGETVDGGATVLVTERDRLAVSILDDRVSEVFILGTHARAIGELLRAVASDGT